MDVTNFKFNLKEYSKIEDRAERLFFLRDLEKSLKALPEEQKQQLLKEREEYAMQLIDETAKYLADETAYEMPEKLEKLIKL